MLSDYYENNLEARLELYDDLIERGAYNYRDEPVVNTAELQREFTDVMTDPNLEELAVKTLFETVPEHLRPMSNIAREARIMYETGSNIKVPKNILDRELWKDMDRTGKKTMIKQANRWQTGFIAENWEQYIQNLLEPPKIEIKIPEINQQNQNVGISQNPQLNFGNLDLPQNSFEQKRYLKKTSKLSLFSGEELKKDLRPGIPPYPFTDDEIDYPDPPPYPFTDDEFILEPNLDTERNPSFFEKFDQGIENVAPYLTADNLQFALLAGFFTTLPLTTTYNYFTGKNSQNEAENIKNNGKRHFKKLPRKKSRRKRNFKPRFKKTKIFLPNIQKNAKRDFVKNISYDDNPCNPIVRDRIIRETGTDPCPFLA